MRRGPAALVALFVLAGGGRALGHAPPLGTGLWWVSPPDGATDANPRERLIIRTPRGLLLESSRINDFRFLCNEAVGISDNEDASVADLGGDGLLLATWKAGLLRGSADGCTWDPVTTVAAAPAFDVAVTGSGAKSQAYVVGGMPHQGDHFWAGRDAGRSWSALGNSDFPYTRIRVAPSNPARIYVTGIGLNAMGTAIHRLGVSDDGGQTVVDRLIALGPSDLQARVLGVDPMRPDHVYVWAESNSADVPERLLVSQDGGQSFTTGVTLLEILGFAQSDDGKTVWVGGKAGVYRSFDGGRSFSPVAGDAVTNVTCLAFHDNQLYACGALNGQLVVAVSQDGGDSFRKVFSFDQVRQGLDCPGVDPAVSPATVCAASLEHWRYELGTLDEAGAGGAGGAGVAPAAAPGGNTGTLKAGSTSAGCAIGGTGEGAASVPLCTSFLAGIALARRRGHQLARGSCQAGASRS